MGGLFSGPKVPAPPPVPAPAPLPDDAAIAAAKRAAIQQQMMRSGRLSTILTGDDTGTKLGG
jgi:hypothetical protein